MSKNNDGPYTLNKALVRATSWSGKTTFGFFVLMLILGGITYNLADPQYSVYTASDEYEVYQSFTMSGDGQYQIAMVSFSGNLDFQLRKVEYQIVNSSEVNDFRQSDTDIRIFVEVISIESNEVYRNEYLQRGEYQILVQGDPGDDFFLGSGEFNIGLVTATLIVAIIFSVVISIFSIVLPFTIISLVITAIVGLGRPSAPATPRPVRVETPAHPPPRREEQVTYTTPVAQAPVAQTTARPEPSPRPTTPTWLQGTFVEKMTKNDKVVAGFGFFFLLMFFVAPGGPFLFFTIAVVLYLAYTISEREKLKDRLVAILSLYPHTTISFLEEQLGKTENQIVEALRLMILDEGYPIRLNLIEKTVEKIGDFPASPPRFSGSVAPPVQTRSEPATTQTHEVIVKVKGEEAQPKVEDSTKFETKVTAGSSGEVTEPMMYCSACGEAMLKEVMYCYSCGARQ